MCYRNFSDLFRTAILKENLPMDVYYFIKEHLWMSAFDEATLKKVLVEVNPSQSWLWKQSGSMAAVMIFEEVCCR